jgi:hypothetical protein
MNLRRNAALLLFAGSMVSTGAMLRPTVAHAAPASQTGRVATKCRQPTTAALSTSELRDATAGKPMDAICFVAGVCSTVWPIGTLICGPTMIGCAIMYW